MALSLKEVDEGVGGMRTFFAGGVEVYGFEEVVHCLIDAASNGACFTWSLEVSVCLVWS